MLSAKENYRIAARGGKPERVPVFPEDVNVYMPSVWNHDPLTGRDWLGVRWINDPQGQMPDILHPVLQDVTEWPDTLHFPDLSQIDWAAEIAQLQATNYDPQKIDVALVHTCGPFLLPINLLGWEEGLAALYEHPREMGALITRITDFLVELVGYIQEYYHPEIMFTGDDLAAAGGPFISREIWTEFYKPQFKRIAAAIHGAGALAEFHNCGNNQWLIEEFLDCGADICQLPMPNPALEADKRRFGSRLVITGGWDRLSAAAKLGATEAEVRASARTAIDTYGRDGAFIFWDGGIIFSAEDAQQKMAWLYDEVHQYGGRIYQSQP